MTADPQRMVVRDVLDNGLRLITETMPHVRSVTIGVWLMRGSRHESDDRSGIATTTCTLNSSSFAPCTSPAW